MFNNLSLITFHCHHPSLRHESVTQKLFNSCRDGPTNVKNTFRIMYVGT